DIALDARPSDAIALALRLHGPILVDEELFAKVAASQPEPAALRLWGLTVQNLTPEIAAFFELSDEPGVLVSDVTVGGPAHEVARGDLITALDGEPIRSVRELRERAGAHSGAVPGTADRTNPLGMAILLGLVSVPLLFLFLPVGLTMLAVAMVMGSWGILATIFRRSSPPR